MVCALDEGFAYAAIVRPRRVEARRIELNILDESCSVLLRWERVDVGCLE